MGVVSHSIDVMMNDSTIDFPVRRRLDYCVLISLPSPEAFRTFTAGVETESGAIADT